MTTDENAQLAHIHHKSAEQRQALQLLVNDLDNPANVGSLFRLADALGLEKVLLAGTTPVPPNRKLRLASRAAEKYVSYERHDDLMACIERLKTNGYRIVALEITSASVDVRKLNVASDEKVCLLLGNERKGVGPALLSACDDTVHIPMQGNNSSMNVSMAAGIACFELLRGRLAASPPEL